MRRTSKKCFVYSLQTQDSRLSTEFAMYHADPGPNFFFFSVSVDENFRRSAAAVKRKNFLSTPLHQLCFRAAYPEKTISFSEDGISRGIVHFLN